MAWAVAAVFALMAVMVFARTANAGKPGKVTAHCWKKCWVKNHTQAKANQGDKTCWKKCWSKNSKPTRQTSRSDEKCWKKCWTKYAKAHMKKENCWKACWEKNKKA